MNVFKKSSFQAQSIALLALSILAACHTTSSIDSGSSKKGGARLSDVRVQLPASTSFKPSQGSAKVNTLQVVVKPKDSSCANATQLNATISYDNPAINQQFRKGCDYLLTVALGEKASGNNSMKIYYQNSPEKLITASDLEANPVNVAINLELTADGVAANMPASLSIQPQQPQPQPNVPQPQPQQPTIQPLSGRLAGVKLLNGQNQPVDLATIFTRDYLLVDYSQPGCGPCISHAQEMNRDASYQKRFSGSGKCTNIVLMYSSDTIGDWLSEFPSSTFVGQKTFGYSGGANQFSGLVGGDSITGTPTFTIIDRSGKIVASQVGAEPQQVDTLCQ